MSGLHHVLEIAAIPARPAWLVMHPDVAERPPVRLDVDRIAEGFRVTATGRTFPTGTFEEAAATEGE